MARKRRISYLATARLAVVCGAVALLSLIIGGVTGTAMPAPLATVAGILGVGAWFLGAAAGVLSLGTPHKRLGGVGLALCGLAAVGAIALSALRG